ncbi:hypothetical protein TNCV_4006941 [Trichonephila clavipes]|nr:hypothetical protein TNCV_4006941 [Trichonephila clavipes]
MERGDSVEFVGNYKDVEISVTAWKNNKTVIMASTFAGEKPLGKWLEHRTPYRKAWVRCPMPANTLRIHTEQKPLVAGVWRIFSSPPEFYALIVEIEIGSVIIYRVEVQPGSGNFHSFPSGKTRQ